MECLSCLWVVGSVCWREELFLLLFFMLHALSSRPPRNPSFRELLPTQFPVPQQPASCIWPASCCNGCILVLCFRLASWSTSQGDVSLL